MSYIYYNPNPLKLSVGDCTIRAISCALNYSWKHTYLSLAIQGFKMYSMARGYSRHGNSKQEMIEELQQMMGETNDEKIKAAIQEAITRMNK